MRIYHTEPTIDRFNRHWTPEPFSGCWLWMGTGYTNGYGKFHINEKRVLAHRVAYQLYRGEIPKGLHLDHLCRTRCCVNPHHLEPVTARENILRGTGKWAQQARQTHCIHGHPLSGDNLYRHARHRYCKTCRRRVFLESYNRRKEQGPRI